MKIIWEDFRTKEGSKTEFTARILLGNGYGYDEDVHVFKVVVAVVRKKNRSTWRCILDGDAGRAIRYKADTMEEAKIIAIEHAAAYVGSCLVPIMKRKEQEHRDGLF